MPHIEIALNEIPEGRPVRLEHHGYGIVVVRDAGGVHAYEDVCPHAGWRLSEGELSDGRLECPGHGWQFEMASGRCQEVPFYCLKKIAVDSRDGRVRLSWETGEGGIDGPPAL